MYKTIEGDLIKLAEQGQFDIICQGCNCFHTMGSGIAGQLASKYPQVLEADKCSIYGERIKLGKWTEAIVDTETHTFIVCNAYTQFFFGLGKDVFEYDAFEKFLKVFAKSTYDYKHEYEDKVRIGFPMIGAGLAGGNWNRISKMIEKFAENVSEFADVTVVIYKP
jgi:O-acetyl-ADP-ribose deacetylase (regulator of RNase III)